MPEAGQERRDNRITIVEVLSNCEQCGICYSSHEGKGSRWERVEGMAVQKARHVNPFEPMRHSKSDTDLDLLIGEC